MLDPISEMLTSIRNAQMAQKKEVVIASSKLKFAIAKLLTERKFVTSVAETDVEGRKFLKIVLRYIDRSRTLREPAINSIRRVSREGQRVYIQREDIRKVKNGLGMAIISTSKGLMSGEKAYRTGLGGEYICEVW